ncbi:MAG: hypothetical protein OXP71_00330 [Candidatus Poribacteria bacterium]|nr:hypothetical protein [Candidatus Poribacteria bacterium]
MTIFIDFLQLTVTRAARCRAYEVWGGAIRAAGCRAYGVWGGAIRAARCRAYSVWCGKQGAMSPRQRVLPHARQDAAPTACGVVSGARCHPRNVCCHSRGNMPRLRGVVS